MNNIIYYKIKFIKLKHLPNLKKLLIEHPACVTHLGGILFSLVCVKKRIYMVLAAQRLITPLKYQQDVFLYWKYDKAASILYVATGTILDISIPANARH